MNHIAVAFFLLIPYTKAKYLILSILCYGNMAYNMHTAITLHNNSAFVVTRPLHYLNRSEVACLGEPRQAPEQDTHPNT